MRAEAAAVVLHVGRAWNGTTPEEDACPCPKAPCGLVASDTTAPDCRQHGYLHPPKTLRQGHAASRCPGLEPHHRAGKSRTDDEHAAITGRPSGLDRLARGLDVETVERGRRIAAHFRSEP